MKTTLMEELSMLQIMIRGAIIAFPFMLLISVLDPVRNPVSFGSYFLCYFSVSITLIGFRCFSRKSEVNHLNAIVACIGEQKARRIMGEDRFERAMRYKEL
ncbi:hypothetical protein A3715_11325 [Oleiphilus sp. HI0009]|nr:hypothetical protein A3715_25530 [Oleiphilus sp. HI0009]KZX77297.1 hypothetical protein A3715_11325 [Oleiphilus sp. HI0009]